MKLYRELDLSTFKAWSGAIETYETIKGADKLIDLECLLEDLYI